MNSSKLITSLLIGCLAAAAPAGIADVSSADWDNLRNQARKAETRGESKQAELLYNQAVDAARAFGGDDARLAMTLFDMSRFYRYQGKYEKALSWARQANDVMEKQRRLHESGTAPSDPGGEQEAAKARGPFESDDPGLAEWEEYMTVFNNLIQIYVKLGRYKPAEKLLVKRIDNMENKGSRDPIEEPEAITIYKDLLGFVREKQAGKRN